MKQATAAIGLVVMVVSALALLFTVRDFVAAMHSGGPSGAYNSSRVVFWGVLALTTFLIASGLLREHLRQRAARLVLAIATVVLVVVGAVAGYVG
ncbi:MAG: hypothetical protein ACHQK9_15805 [Reyranellales bacterium]